MFTGIISEVGVVRRLVPGGTSRLEIEAPATASRAAVGDSIAVNGACLTVVELIGTPTTLFAAQAMGETLSRTNLGRLSVESRVNLERALRLGDGLDGHLVQGHIDDRARLVELRSAAGSQVLTAELPGDELTRFLAPKGSVALDGVSLTLIEVTGRRFSVGLIPHTARTTTLGGLKPGWELNLEVDLLARYLDRLLRKRPGGLDRAFLAEHGFY